MSPKTKIKLIKNTNLNKILVQRKEVIIRKKIRYLPVRIKRNRLKSSKQLKKRKELRKKNKFKSGTGKNKQK